MSSGTGALDGNSPDQVVALSARHSHLFRGARVSASRRGLSLPLRPSAVWLAFRDGIEVDAELLEGGSPESLALAVPAYRTAAGHQVAAAVWPVTEVIIDQSGDEVLLRLGQRIG